MEEVNSDALGLNTRVFLCSDSKKKGFLSFFSCVTRTFIHTVRKEILKFTLKSGVICLFFVVVL